MNETPKILIVEDQYFVAADCELHLNAAGYECVGCATTAASAIELAERERPDFIIMDIHLAQDSDGVEAAIGIYERLGIRCLFASAHADDLVRKAAARAHPLGWLDKPYTSEELLKSTLDCIAQLSVESALAGPQDVAASVVH